jgi:ABC-type bacteriocin/lantibiotic exporter with double-glycine peptidase domain
MIRIWNFCKKFFYKHIAKLLLLILVSVAVSLCTIMLPMISGKFVDFLTSQGKSNPKGLSFFLRVFLFVSIISMVLSYALNRLFTDLQSRISYQMNLYVVQNAQRLRLEYFQSKNTNRLSQQILSDTNTLTTFYLSFFQNIIINTVKAVLPVFIIFKLNIKLLIVIIVLLILYVVCYYWTRKKLYSASYNLKEEQASFFSSFYEQLHYVYYIRLHGMLNDFILKTTAPYLNLYNATMHSQNIQYLSSSADTVILMLGQLAVFFIGGNAVINREISMGNFTVLTTYFNMMVGAVRYFYSLGGSMQAALVSLDRICPFIDVRSESRNKQTLDKVNRIIVSNITFGYLNDDTIINNFSHEFFSGKIYSLCGANGCGKSTLLQLIVGLYEELGNGRILYDFVSINELDMNWMRRHKIGYVEQEPELLNETLRENIIQDSSFSNEYYKKLLKKLHLTEGGNEVLNRSNEKASTSFANISGGERQKIALIRELLKNPSILILDEPTASMDIESVNNFISIIQREKLYKIVIIATHDKRIIDISDEVICL